MVLITCQLRGFIQIALTVASVRHGQTPLTNETSVKFTCFTDKQQQILTIGIEELILGVSEFSTDYSNHRYR